MEFSILRTNYDDGLPFVKEAANMIVQGKSVLF